MKSSVIHATYLSLSIKHEQQLTGSKVAEVWMCLHFENKRKKKEQMDETKYLSSLLYSNTEFFHLTSKYWISYDGRWHHGSFEYHRKHV